MGFAAPKPLPQLLHGVSQTVSGQALPVAQVPQLMLYVEMVNQRHPTAANSLTMTPGWWKCPETAPEEQIGH